jgi:hypothetical protein
LYLLIPVERIIPRELPDSPGVFFLITQKHYFCRQTPWRASGGGFLSFNQVVEKRREAGPGEIEDFTRFN